MTLDEWRRVEPILTDALLLPDADRARKLESVQLRDAIRVELLAVLQRTSAIFPRLTPGQGVLTPPSSGDVREGPLLAGGDDLGDGRFTVIRELGRGGMGEVYLAHDRRLGGLVALKLLFDAQLREAQHARLCSGHPHIATLHDIFETTVSNRNVTVLVIEYVAGRPASRVLQDGPPSIAEAVRWSQQIASALSHAHDQEVLHCDLKPANVLIAADGSAKVVDFGIGRRTFDHDSREPSRGTFAYMAPEQLLEGRFLPAGDIYSLGVTLFELVTGRLPFDAELPSLALQIAGAPAPRPSEFRAGVPSQLDEIVACSLAKQPQDRFQSARAFHRALVVLDESPRARSSVVVPSHHPGRNRYRSLAVLPFANRLRATSEQYLADALTSEIITRLARLKGVLVISRSGVERYRNSPLPAADIGRELAVQTVMEGAITKAGEKWRITAQLLEVDSGFCLWADSYEFAVNDLFDIQVSVSQRIARALRSRFSLGDAREEAPVGLSAEAYHLYLQGKALYYRFNSTDNLLACDAFRRALAIEPRYARGYAALASACIARLEREWESDEARWIADALSACERAVALDPWCSDAYSARGLVFLRQGRMAEAEAEFRRALTINPNDDIAHSMLGRVLFERGDLLSALRSFRRAVKICPDYVWCWNDLAWAAWLMGRYDDTERALARVLAINPVDEVARIGLATGHYFRGDLDAAVATAKRSIEQNPSHPFSRPVLAVALARQGHLDEAVAVAQDTLERHPTEFLMSAALAVIFAIVDDDAKLRHANARALTIPALRVPLNMNVAVHFAFLGRGDVARAWIEKAEREGMSAALVVKHNPLLRVFAPDFVARRSGTEVR